MTDLDPDYPQRGPHESPEEITACREQGETGGGQVLQYKFFNTVFNTVDNSLS
jgi:hypothetical protein